MTESAEVPRSRFVNQWSHKKTFDAGYLYPFMVDWVYPGDHMRYNATALVRTATPLFPIMDAQRVDTFGFFVPYRLLWANFARFMGEQDSPGDSIAYTMPQVVSPLGGFAAHSIYDHFGLPTAIDPAGTLGVMALPLRAYRLIYHEWFRDQNLINSTKPSTGNGPDPATDYALLRRAKSADYFTTCLPWPQKFTAPAIGLTGTVPVLGLAIPNAAASSAGDPGGNQTGNVSTASWTRYYDALGDNLYVQSTGAGAGAAPNIYADLAQATGVAINTFRQAFLIQQLLERDARGGSRYTESVFSHFRVQVPDFRLQRPEYIGGGSSDVNFTPIAQTAPAAGSVVGELAATGTSAGQHTLEYAAQEHGVIIWLINVKSELSYQEGVWRQWSTLTRYDMYYPSTAQLGEQAVLRRELMHYGQPQDFEVFGYQERWHELRTRVSEVTGQFRTNAPGGTLDSWHLAQWFTSHPTLGQTFIEDNPPMSRVLAAGALAANQQYLADIVIRREATRPVPMYGTPVNLGRF